MSFWWRSLSIATLLALPSGCFGGFETFEWNRPARLSSTATLIDYVDPFIGTSGIPWASGHVSPAATRPFGMVKLGPDSSLLGKTLSHSGYAHNDPELVGFSLTRYSGTGVGEGGVLRVKPLTDERGFKALQQKRYIADKRTEIAHPGYYSVYLHAEKTKVELTASARAGVHRYYFEQAKPHLVVQLSSAHKGSMENLSVNVTANGFEGSGRLHSGFSNRYDGLPVFFAAQLSHPVESHRFVTESQSSVQATYANAGDVETFLDLKVNAPAGQEVLLKIGISYTSLAAAQAHLAEVSGSFDNTRTATENAWQDVLKRILVEGGSKRDKVTFYSAMYRSFLMPTQFGDTNGGYYGGDKQIHSSADPYYSDFSLWDTFRTVHPLYSLVARDEQADMMKSLLLIYQQSGYLTRWFSGAGHTGSMLGAPAVIALSEAYLKGVTDFDLNLAFTAMQAALNPNIDSKGKECLSAYAALGFCPANSREGSVSYTLEYAYADDALSRFADAKGDSAVATAHRDRAKLALRRQFDSRNLAFLPRLASGEFEDLGPKGPSWQDSSYIKLGKTGKAFVEGGARHWRFYSIFDVDTTKSLYGDRIEPILDHLFENSLPAIGSAFPPYYYWHGNEPGFTQAYWYALLGDLPKTQKWVKWILENKYSDKASGLDGDDDAGTISAWYVFSAMGIFPIAGTDRYVVGYPLFDAVTIDIGGDTFRIEKNSNQVSQVYLNGTKMSDYTFRHSDLVDGGRLSFGGDSP